MISPSWDFAKSIIGRLHAYAFNVMSRAISLLCLVTTAVLAQESSPNKRLRNAAMSFQEIMATPDKAIPQELFDKAQCIIIVPDLLKGAFGVGGKYGRGYASCRHGAHGWSSPAAVAIEGGSFGLQLGGSSTDVIMLVMNQKGMNRLLGDKFTLGGEAAAAAGPGGPSGKREYGRLDASGDSLMVAFTRRVCGAFPRRCHHAARCEGKPEALRPRHH